MFNPKYHISDKLLANIKKITIICIDLNNKSFPKTMLANFETNANSLSSYASTSIEGNPLPLTEVKKIIKSKPENVKNTEREVLNYNNTLEMLNKKIKDGQIDVTMNFICGIQRQITTGLIEQYRCGKLRKEPVFVNNPKTGKSVYLPPDHQDVSTLIKKLIDFIKTKRGHIEPLILAGLFHKQFVIIHPFIDGNGRTCRLITKALLADMGLNTFNLFSFENYYNKNISTYFFNVGLFGNYYEIVQDIDFTDWLEYFTTGIIDELLRVKKELEIMGLTPETVLQMHHKKILHFIKQKGFITDKDYSKLTDRAKATRALDFNKLIEMKLIKRFEKGRSTYYKLT